MAATTNAIRISPKQSTKSFYFFFYDQTFTLNSMHRTLVHLFTNSTHSMPALDPEAVRAAARPAIRGLIRVSQEVMRGQVNRIVLDDDASDLPGLGALLRRRRLEAFPEAMTQLIEILARSLAAETVAARPGRSSM